MKISPQTRKLGLLTLALAVAGLVSVQVYRARKDARKPSLPPGVREFAGPIVQAGDYRLSGPHTHANLTVFLVHGQDQHSEASYLTLSEALDQEKVVVHETGNVNELAVENLSPDQELYIQSGDIVKGGRQDRALHYDLVLAPKSGKVPWRPFALSRGAGASAATKRSRFLVIPATACRPRN
jgi:hypothetical protein